MAASLLVALALLIRHAFDAYGAFYHDDAFISLRYARNWLAGIGPVWNPGERVEGYTNFLWIAATTALGRLGVDLVGATRLLGSGAWALLLLLFGGGMAAVARRHNQPPLAALWPWLLVAGSYPLVIWSRGGLEGVAFTLWLTAGLFVTLDAPAGRKWEVVAGLAFALAALTRPEGVLFWGTAVLHRWRLAGRRAALPLIASFLLLYLPYFLWRWSYYDAFLPNTFYVKSTITPLGRLLGGNYLLSFLFTAPFWGVWLGVLAVRGRRTPAVDYLALTLALYLGYVALIGGDHMPAFRLLLPAIPLLARLLYEGLRPALATASNRRLFFLNVLALATLAGQALTPAEAIKRAHTVDSAAFVGAIVGRYIDTAWPAGSLIALHTAGATPYIAADHAFVDMLGLNDAHIARRAIPPPTLPWQHIPGHAKGDGAYVLRRQPDYIILGPAEGAPAGKPLFLSDAELDAQPAFHDNYRQRTVTIDATIYPGWRFYRATQTGNLEFTYFERK